MHKEPKSFEMIRVFSAESPSPQSSELNEGDGEIEARMPYNSIGVSEDGEADPEENLKERRKGSMILRAPSSTTENLNKMVQEKVKSFPITLDGSQEVASTAWPFVTSTSSSYRVPSKPSGEENSPLLFEIDDGRGPNTVSTSPLNEKSAASREPYPQFMETKATILEIPKPTGFTQSPEENPQCLQEEAGVESYILGSTIGSLDTLGSFDLENWGFSHGRYSIRQVSSLLSFGFDVNSETMRQEIKNFCDGSSSFMVGDGESASHSDIVYTHDLTGELSIRHAGEEGLELPYIEPERYNYDCFDLEEAVMEATDIGKYEEKIRSAVLDSEIEKVAGIISRNIPESAFMEREGGFHTRASSTGSHSVLISSRYGFPVPSGASSIIDASVSKRQSSNPHKKEIEHYVLGPDHLSTPTDIPPLDLGNDGGSDRENVSIEELVSDIELVGSYSIPKCEIFNTLRSSGSFQKYSNWDEYLEKHLCMGDDFRHLGRLDVSPKIMSYLKKGGHNSKKEFRPSPRRLKFHTGRASRAEEQITSLKIPSAFRHKPKGERYSDSPESIVIVSSSNGVDVMEKEARKYQSPATRASQILDKTWQKTKSTISLRFKQPPNSLAEMFRDQKSLEVCSMNNIVGLSKSDSGLRDEGGPCSFSGETNTLEGTQLKSSANDTHGNKKTRRFFFPRRKSPDTREESLKQLFRAIDTIDIQHEGGTLNEPLKKVGGLESS